MYNFLSMEANQTPSSVLPQSPRGYFKPLAVFAALLLVASLAFHVQVDAHSSMQTQWIGVGFILSSMLVVVLLALAFPLAGGPDPELRVSVFGWVNIVVAWVVFYLLFLKAPGPWSEEVWWTELGKSVASGSVVNPIGFKGDHPANFQAWPVGLFLALTGDPILSTRLPGALYAFGTVFFVTATVALYGRMKSAFGCCVLGLLSISALHYSQSGWNEMNSAPLLVSCQFYFLSRALLLSCRRSLLLAAFFAGFSFWSLYTPALFALIVMGFIAIAGRATFNFRMKLLSLLCFLLLATPTIGKIVHHADIAVGRHEAFLRGGEWHRQFDENYRPLPTYLHTLQDIGMHILPSVEPFDRTALLAINLEYTTMGLLVIGFLWGLLRLDRKRQLLLYGSSFLLLVGLVLTNPSSSTWRELCLWSPLLIFAGLGLQALLNAAERLSPLLCSIVLSFVLVAHVYFFGFHYLTSRVGFFGDSLSDQVNVLYAGVRPYLSATRLTYLPNTNGGWFARLLASPFPGKLPYRTYATIPELEHQPGSVVIVTLASDPEMPSSMQVAEYLSAHSRTYQEVKITDVVNEAGSVFLVGK